MYNEKTHNSRPVDEVTIRRLWDKIKATFANKKDVLEIVKELERLENTSTVTAVQSGVGGPVIPAGSDNTVHLKYENYVESTTKDALGNTVHSYNESNNALSTAAAAMAIKSIRQDIKNLNIFGVQVVTTVDSLGHPIVPEISFNTLYLTPGGNNEEDNQWNEWLAVQDKYYAPYASDKDRASKFHWELIGNKSIDLRWVKRDLVTLNNALKKVWKKIDIKSELLKKWTLDEAIKPLKELQDYINSPEYTKFIFAQLPRAAMGTDGLMSANSFAILSMLAIWASNDQKVMGGGALGPDVVSSLFKEQGFDTSVVDKEFNTANFDI